MIDMTERDSCVQIEQYTMHMRKRQARRWRRVPTNLQSFIFGLKSHQESTLVRLNQKSKPRKRYTSKRFGMTGTDRNEIKNIEPEKRERGGHEVEGETKVNI